ncbi:hypothetical protein B0H12DRAFT_263834 [Mycena haematopus]|nr:hypothetical protein B0H12DRAFT_263834 [Mycena haematopus]
MPSHAQDDPSPIYAHTVSPDFDCRPVSPLVSECSESSHATDDSTASRTIGFGRKRHSVISTVHPNDFAQSKMVGFGWKQHRHSVSGAPPPLFTPDRKQDNRRSLPVVPRVGPFLVDPGDFRASINLVSTRLSVLDESRVERPPLAPPTARRMSRANRQPPKPLLLPQKVQTRAPPSPSPSRVKVCLILIASFRPVKFLVSRFAAARLLRLKRLNLTRQAGDEARDMKSFLRRLRKLYRRLRGL